MAKGNWSKYRPRARCYICGKVIIGYCVRVDGYHPAHEQCAKERKAKIESDRSRGL